MIADDDPREMARTCPEIARGELLHGRVGGGCSGNVQHRLGAGALRAI